MLCYRDYCNVMHLTEIELVRFKRKKRNLLQTLVFKNNYQNSTIVKLYFTYFKSFSSLIQSSRLNSNETFSLCCFVAVTNDYNARLLIVTNMFIYDATWRLVSILCVQRDAVIGMIIYFVRFENPWTWNFKIDMNILV